MSHSPKAKVRPVLLLEINEVPWRLVDRFRDGYPNLKRFLAQSQTYTTTAVDSGELSPWITWPSFHRGLCDKEHGVKFLGQDPKSYKGTPIWEEYRSRGHSIGICGSLQSWPPVDPGKNGFYIPDTFAHDASCIPSSIEAFQKFNLGQVAANGRTVNANSLLSSDLFALVKSLPWLGVRPSTLARVAGQLVAERFDKVKLSRRPIFQSILIWDVFKNLYDPKNPPAFSTFFTNHIAGVMHRYWDNIFPEDFGTKLTGKPTPYLATLHFALELLDEMLGTVFEWTAQNPDLVVVWASSMGQDTVHRSFEGAELAVADAPRLYEACGLARGEYRPMLAMVPQIAVEVVDPARRSDLQSLLEGSRTSSKKPVFRVEGAASSLSITIINPKRADIDAGGFHLGKKWVNWADVGVRVVHTDPGTAYHIPEGTMAVYGNGFPARDDRTVMKASDAKSFILNLAGVAVAAPAKVKKKRVGKR